MRKYLCIILAIVALFSVFAITASAISSVDYNAALLYRELNTVQPNSKEQARRIAAILDEIGIGRIVESQVNHYGERYSVRFSDEHGNIGTIIMEDTSLIAILDGNNFAIWGGSEIVSSPWWFFLPSWLQCVVRVVFFGWIWMRYPWVESAIT